MEDLSTRIEPRALAASVDAVMDEVIELRRWLHAHPEPSGEEYETAATVARRLRALGLEVREGVGGTGVVGLLCARPEAPWLALRADMDALPVTDEKTADYRSRRDGCAHACGHDAHTAMLLGAAIVLAGLREHLRCNLAFVFQPAEETCAGAAAMLADGLFADIKPAGIYALHVYPYLPSGHIGIRHGVMCAAADMFEVEIHGRGGHAARPHECVDVILVASQIIQALHHIVGRRVNPLTPAVLTIGEVHGGHAANVIPESVRFSGTVRTLHPETHETIRALMDRIIRQTAESWGATARFTLRQATPVLENDEARLAAALQALERLAPDLPTVTLDTPSMGGEDFAEYLRVIPGCLFRLGTGADPATRFPLHHPCFDIDERAMREGIRLFAALALNERART